MVDQCNHVNRDVRVGACASPANMLSRGGMNDQSGNPATTEGGLVIRLCPFCDEQATNDPRKPRKRLDCPRCKSRFTAVAPEHTFDCAHCGIRLQVSGWIVGHDVRCPHCRGPLKLRWEDDEAQEHPT